MLTELCINCRPLSGLLRKLMVSDTEIQSNVWWECMFIYAVCCAQIIDNIKL